MDEIEKQKSTLQHLEGMISNPMRLDEKGIPRKEKDIDREISGRKQEKDQVKATVSGKFNRPFSLTIERTYLYRYTSAQMLLLLPMIVSTCRHFFLGDHLSIFYLSLCSIDTTASTTICLPFNCIIT